MPCLQLRMRSNNEHTKHFSVITSTQNTSAIHMLQDFKIRLKALNGDKLVPSTLNIPYNAVISVITQMPDGKSCSKRPPSLNHELNLHQVREGVREDNKKKTVAIQNVLLFSL